MRRPAASVAMASAPLRAPRRHASGARTTGMAGKDNPRSAPGPVITGLEGAGGLAA